MRLVLSSDLSAIIKQIADHLRINPVNLQITPIWHGTLERNNVWRLAVAEKDYILKQHLIAQPIGKSAFTPFQIEIAVLEILHRAGCRVPKIVWKSEDDLTLLLEGCGEKTLDDLAQETLADALKPITRNAVREFCRLELAFADCAEVIKPYIYPLGNPLHHTLDTVLDRGRKTMNYLAWLSGGPMPPDEQAMVNEVWGDMSNCLHDAAATLGSLDYNARNVMIDGDRPAFIDFASVGWDWGEKASGSIVQQFRGTSIGWKFCQHLKSRGCRRIRMPDGKSAGTGGRRRDCRASGLSQPTLLPIYRLSAFAGNRSTGT